MTNLIKVFLGVLFLCLSSPGWGAEEFSVETDHQLMQSRDTNFIKYPIFISDWRYNLGIVISDLYVSCDSIG